MPHFCVRTGRALRTCCRCLRLRSAHRTRHAWRRATCGATCACHPCAIWSLTNPPAMTSLACRWAAAGVGGSSDSQRRRWHGRRNSRLYLRRRTPLKAVILWKFLPRTAAGCEPARASFGREKTRFTWHAANRNKRLALRQQAATRPFFLTAR